jgi:L-erythrulose 1-phosphate isomerase
LLRTRKSQFQKLSKRTDQEELAGETKSLLQKRGVSPASNYRAQIMSHRRARTFFGTNWKMRNIQRWQALEYVRILSDGLEQLRSKETAEVFVLPPATLLRDMALAGAEGPILFGAQNFHWEEEGEFTGELSIELLLEAGASVFMAGHAERRISFGEENEIVNRKVLRTLKEGLRTVLCIGELSWELAPDQLQAELADQLQAALRGVEITEATRLVIANEPYWAIGRAAQSAASASRVSSAITLIRQSLNAILGDPSAVPLIYGGNVNLDNCVSLMVEGGVDGLFIGQAATNPTNFVSVISRALSALP